MARQPGWNQPPPSTTPPAPPAPNGQWSVYNPSPGLDPEWDAFIAAYNYRIANMNAQAEQARRKLQGDYDYALAELDAGASSGRRTTCRA